MASRPRFGRWWITCAVGLGLAIVIPTLCIGVAILTAPQPLPPDYFEASARQTVEAFALTPLPTRTPRPAYAALPPGPVIFFEKADSSVWAARGDGSEPRELSSAPYRPAITPTPRPRTDSGPGPGPFPGPRIRWAPAPDGRAIAVAEGYHDYDGAAVTAYAELWFVTTTGEQKQLLSLVAPGLVSPSVFGSEEAGTRQSYALAPPQPAWSPDSRSVAIVSAHQGSHDLYTVEVATGAIRRLTVDRAREGEPLWSPDGRWIAYCAPKTDYTGKDRLSVVAADGASGPRELATGRCGYAMWMDNATLLWVSRPEGVGVQTLRRLSVDGWAQTVFPEGAAGLAWNASARQLAFTWMSRTTPPFETPPDLNFGAYVWDAASGKAEKVSPYGSVDVAWAPTGPKRLAFTNVRGPGEGVYIWTDGQPEAVALAPFGALGKLVWAPDGQRLAFGHQIVTLADKSVIAYTPMAAVPVAWTREGLVYWTAGPRGAKDQQLYVWDGSTSRLIADGLDVVSWPRPDAIRVVTPIPSR